MAAPMDLEITSLRVSSVLNRDTKQFGKKHLTDGDDDTCWNSDQGSPQWISGEFDSPVVLHEVHILFQGGFAGRECWIEGRVPGADDWLKVRDIYPEDSNALQTFKLEPASEKLSSVKIVFNNSTDFFGRITVYKIKFVGEKS